MVMVNLPFHCHFRDTDDVTAMLTEPTREVASDTDTNGLMLAAHRAASCHDN